MEKVTPEALSIATASALFQLLLALRRKGVLTPKEIDAFMTEAYLGQMTPEGDYPSEANKKAQAFLTEAWVDLRGNGNEPTG